MSSTLEKPFCGHCGERLPPFGSDLGYCATCARTFKRTVTSELREVASRMRASRSPDWRDPVRAGLLSFVFPGAGQAYNGHWVKAVLVFVTSPFVIPWVIGIVDAFFSARRSNEARVETGATFAAA